MKRFVMGLIVGIAISTCGAVFAEDGLQKVEAYLRPSLPITLNGTPVTLDNPPVMYDGSTYLRLRDIAKLTGIGVDWNQQTQTVVLSTYGAPTSSTTTAPNTPQGGTPVTGYTSDSFSGQNTKERKIETLKGQIDSLRASMQGLEMSLGESDLSDAMRTKMQNAYDDQKKQLADLQSQLDQLQSQP